MEQTHDEQYPSNEKKLLAPSHLIDTDVLFLVMARIFPPTAMTALLFQHRIRTPTFHHLLWHFSESFHQYSNDLIAPDWLWRGSIFVPLSADTAQILRQLDASSVFQSKSCGMNFYRCLLLRKLHGQTTIFTYHRTHFLNVIVTRWRRRLSRFGIIFNGRSARFETLTPLVTLHTAQTVLPISLLQHLKSLCKGFSQFETEFHANTLLFKILHFSTCKKSPRTLNTHSLKPT